MMKICFCVDTMENGGAERVASVLCNEFVKLNHEVDLVMISERNQKSFYSLDERVRLIPLLHFYQVRFNFFLAKVSALKKLFMSHEYDVVISFLPNVNTCAWLATPKKHKFVHIVSERNNPYIDPKNKLKKKMKELAFKHSDGIVCQTIGSKNYYKKLNVPSRIIINPLSKIQSTTNVKSIRLSNDIISVGRLEEQKNFGLLIKAFSEFSKIHPESRLKIYGVGSLQYSLNELIYTLGISDKASLCGCSNNWITENKHCALFINSSLYEGMPNSLLEALASGMPCIASDCPIGGSKELLSYNNGLLFENDNLEDLTAKMHFLYQNFELVKRFSENNQRMNKTYSAYNIAEQWLAFSIDLINKKGE